MSGDDTGGQPHMHSATRSGFAAHTPNEKGEWHEFTDHLEGVARRTREFGDEVGAGDWAEQAGWWHDQEVRIGP